MAAGGQRCRRVFFGKMVKLGFLSLKKDGEGSWRVCWEQGVGMAPHCFLMQEPEGQRRNALCEVLQPWKEPLLQIQIQRGLFKTFHCR